MSQSNAQETLSKLLDLTREEELDCDAFISHLAAYVEGGVASETLHALMEHHRVICPECEEELQILKRALAAEG